MNFGPDVYSSSEDDGFSDDNDYAEYKAKVKAIQRQGTQTVENEAEVKKKQLKSIFSAISYGKKEVVFEAFDKGLDVNVDLENGWTPLLLAATTANESLFSGLIQRGANVNQARDGGSTPLMYLCSIISNDEDTEKSIFACVNLLLEKNADVNAIDNKRKTAIMLASHHGHFEIVKLLLDLVNKEAIDNQGWDVLFWAVDGNQLKIIEYLLGLDFSHTKTDVRGQTVVDLARINGFEKVLDLFPKDPFDEFYSYLNAHELYFEDTFKSLPKNQKPQFFTDICKMLYGTKSEFVMPILKERNITLGEFLCLSDAKLQEFGVEFPYQRARIMNGLYRFHKRPYRPQSIPFVKKDQIYTNIDVSASVLTCIKQLIAMEASLKFIMQNTPEKLDLVESKEVKILIRKTRQHTKRLKVIAKHLVNRTEKWDSELKPVDRITKPRRNIPWCNLFLAVGVLSAFIIYKLK